MGTYISYSHLQHPQLVQTNTIYLKKCLPVKTTLFNKSAVSENGLVKVQVRNFEGRYKAKAHQCSLQLPVPRWKPSLVQTALATPNLSSVHSTK